MHCCRAMVLTARQASVPSCGLRHHRVSSLSPWSLWRPVRRCSPPPTAPVALDVNSHGTVQSTCSGRSACRHASVTPSATCSPSGRVSPSKLSRLHAASQRKSVTAGHLSEHGDNRHEINVLATECHRNRLHACTPSELRLATAP